MTSLEGERPAEPDGHVRDDADPEEAERGGGYPVIRGGPYPGRSVGGGGQRRGGRDGDRGREQEGEHPPRGGWQPRGGPAFEEHADDEDGSDHAPAGGADGGRLPVGDVAQQQVAKRAEDDDEDVAGDQARRAAGDGVD